MIVTVFPPGKSWSPHNSHLHRRFRGLCCGKTRIPPEPLNSRGTQAISKPDSHFRALIVDDDWTIRQPTVIALSRIGIECHSAANGQQAIEALETAEYDLVITDLSMPVKNGHQLCLELLKRPDRPMIVVMTGITDTKIVTDLLKRGVDDIQFKPVDYRIFIAKIQALVVCRELTLEEEALAGTVAGNDAV